MKVAPLVTAGLAVFLLVTLRVFGPWNRRGVSESQHLDAPHPLAPRVLPSLPEEVEEQHVHIAPPPQTLPPPPPVFEPICQVKFGQHVCVQGVKHVACPDQVDQIRRKTAVTGSGAWVLPETYTYFLDLGLVAELARLFANASTLELGAGKGCYAAALRRDQLRRHPSVDPPLVRAFDGSTSVSALTGGLVSTADLTSELHLGAADWVLCLETAEHIPREYEEVFLQNLHRHNRVGIVVSWSDNVGGNGHVNIRSNAWVARRFVKMGYLHDRETQHALRRAVSDIHWYRDTVMVFRRTKATPDAPLERTLPER
mmetsp:Transcript_12976/g.29352  ORF Transcript_12976/g.29352 Transcript_12976/m.29352 type:complete len:313 (-) Transcript_12976:130-1068(-)